MKVELSVFEKGVKPSVILYVLTRDAKKIIWCKLITTIPKGLHIESLVSLSDQVQF